MSALRIRYRPTTVNFSRGEHISHFRQMKDSQTLSARPQTEQAIYIELRQKRFRKGSKENLGIPWEYKKRSGRKKVYHDLGLVEKTAA